MLSGFCLARFGVLFCRLVLGCRYTPKIILDRVVSSASFLTGGVFECDLAHRRSVAVLCMLYKIRCNPMHPLFGALPVPYVPVRVTRGARTSVHICASSLQNLAVSPDFSSLVSISVERS